MTKVKDGFWKQLGSKVGSDDYLLKAAGGYIGVGNSAGEVVPLNNSTRNAGLNADMVDGYHFSDLEDRYVNITGDTMSGSLTVKQYIFGYNYNHAGGNAPAWVFDKPGSYFTGIGCHSTSDTIWFGAATISSGEAAWVDGYKQKWAFNGTITADYIYSNGLYHVTSGSRSNNYVWNTNGGYTDISSLSSSVSVTNSAPALGKTAATIATIGGTAITASVGDSDKVDGLHFWSGSSLPSSPSSDTIYIIV